jgi:hypothetical protein
MRGLSGHPPKERLYYIPRSNLVPSIELQSLIFPEVDGILHKMIAGDGIEQNLAARGFLELLVYLRRVLLQDCAILMCETPRSRIWSHPIFQSMEFKNFQEDLLSNIESTQDPTEHKLQQAMPILSTQLRNQHSSISNDIKELKLIVTKGNTLLERFVNGGVCMRMYPMDAVVTGQSIHVASSENDTNIQVFEAPKGAVVEVDCNVSVLSYQMNRYLSTVSELWTEWHQGIGSCPSVAFMDTTYGTKWRSGESKFYLRRKLIIEHVKLTMSTRNVSADSAIQYVENIKGSMSLDAFSKHLSRLS